MSLVFFTARKIEAMMSGVAMNAAASGALGRGGCVASIENSPLSRRTDGYSNYKSACRTTS
jgi:hypothetical protein